MAHQAGTERRSTTLLHDDKGSCTTTDGASSSGSQHRSGPTTAAPAAGLAQHALLNGYHEGAGGAAPSDELWLAGDRHRVSRSELVRLMSSCMRHLGYRSSATQLETEAGLLGPPHRGSGDRDVEAAQALSEAVLAGQWGKARALLASVRFKAGEQGRAQAELVLWREEYVTMLLQGQSRPALDLLRQHIEPLAAKGAAGEPSWGLPASLALLLLCPTPGAILQVLGRREDEDDEEEEKEEDGQRGVGRWALEEIRGLLLSPPPPDQAEESAAAASPSSTRLLALLGQALDRQAEACPLHNPAPFYGHGDSLLRDHRCSDGVVPEVCSAILDGHVDEVWALEFSLSGRLLASGGKDRALILWDLQAFVDGLCRGQAAGQVSVKHVARGLGYVPHLLCWSSSSSSEGEGDLLASGNDTTTIQRLSCSDGNGGWRFASTYRGGHSASITGLAWLPSGDKFVSGSLDKRVLLWDAVSGLVLSAWGSNSPGQPRITGLGTTSDGRVVVMCGEKSLKLLSVWKRGGQSQESRQQARTRKRRRRRGAAFTVVAAAAEEAEEEDEEGESWGRADAHDSSPGAGEVPPPSTSPASEGQGGGSASKDNQRPSYFNREPDDDDDEDEEEEEDDEDGARSMSGGEEEGDEEEEEDDDAMMAEDDDEEEEEEEEEDGGRGVSSGGASDTARGSGSGGGGGGGAAEGSDGAAAPSSPPPPSPPPPASREWVLSWKQNVIITLPRPAGAGAGGGAAASGQGVVMTGLSVSGHYAVIDLAGGQVVCWDLDSGKRVGAVLTGRRQRRFILSSRLGGASQGLVAGGSEDGKILVWHREQGKLLTTLKGHGGLVSQVAWCPSHPHVLASASDDHSVRLWLSRESAGTLEVRTGSDNNNNHNNNHRYQQLAVNGV